MRNDFFAELDSHDEPGKKPMEIMAVQRVGSMRIPDDVDGTKGSYAAGTGSGLIHAVKPAGQIVLDIVAEAEQAMGNVREAFVDQTVSV